MYDWHSSTVLMMLNYVKLIGHDLYYISLSPAPTYVIHNTNQHISRKQLDENKRYIRILKVQKDLKKINYYCLCLRNHRNQTN
jgi:hypothetical protein